MPHPPLYLVTPYKGVDIDKRETITLYPPSAEASKATDSSMAAAAVLRQ